MKRLLLWIVVLFQAALAAGISVQDDRGKSVKLNDAAQRVISLTPHVTEMLYHIGAGAVLVGRDGASNYPAAAKALPTVGQYGAFNIEAIVALRPDLIVAWDGPQAGLALSKLRALGIAVFTSQPARADQIADTMRALGKLTGHDTMAQRQASAFDRRWAALLKRYANSKLLSVVLQVSNHPPMTVNDEQFTASLLRACNTSNPFGKVSQPVPLLSPESLFAARPDAIVALADERDLLSWQAPWKAMLPAKGFMVANAETLGRPGPRILAATEELCVRLDALRS